MASLVFLGVQKMPSTTHHEDNSKKHTTKNPPQQTVWLKGFWLALYYVNRMKEFEQCERVVLGILLLIGLDFVWV